jgi:hypothetical protein
MLREWLWWFGWLGIGSGGCAVVREPASARNELPSIADTTRGMTAQAGFYDLYWDAAVGQLWLTIDRFGEELLYVTSLASGLGSNPVGLDRGALREQQVVVFQRSGQGAWRFDSARSEFPPAADERLELARILNDGEQLGYLSITNQDARAESAGHLDAPPGAPIGVGRER